jgi:hypothetical protein
LRGVPRGAVTFSDTRVRGLRNTLVLKLKTPWRDGSAHLVISPLEFM